MPIAPPILSVRDLAARLGSTPERLKEIADNINLHYRYWNLIDKKHGKSRDLNVPRKELKLLQKRINKAILEPIALGECVHGGVRGHSPRSNATVHLGQKCVVCIDVKHFFDSVRHYVVYRMFRRDLGFGRDVARLLTRLTTYDSKLPQGAPTSTAVANLVLAMQVDRPLAVEAQDRELHYSRFVDDITVSGDNPRPLINLAAKSLSSRRLAVHRSTGKGRRKLKLKIMPMRSQQKVTGLIVNSQTSLTIPRDYRDQVRAAIFQLGAMRRGPSFVQAVNSIRGRIAYIRPFNKAGAARLEASLAKVLQ